MNRIPADRRPAVGLDPFEDIDKRVLRRVLDPETGASPEIRAILRSKLGLGAEEMPGPAPAPGTNAPPEKPQA